jgi:hypothetical protein
VARLKCIARKAKKSELAYLWAQVQGSVMLVQLGVENTISLQGHGVQDYHLIICEAVGIDPAWYHGVATEQNSLPRTTPPERGV